MQAAPQLVLETADPLVAFDAELNVVAWNGAAERLLGLPAAEALGRPCWEALGAIDSLGALVCHPGCSIARACRERRAIASARLLVRSRGGRRPALVSTVAVSCDGRRVFVHTLHEEDAARDEERKAYPLTGRQRDVLVLLAEGLGTREIAGALTLSPATVRNHVRSLLEALGCHSRLEAVAKARRLGLV